LPKKVDVIFNILREEFPEENRSPSRSDPLDVLIATMLSQNTTDKTSYIAFRNLKERFRNWEDVMNSPVSRIKNAIRVCGLAKQKAQSIKRMLGQMHRKYGKLDLKFINKQSDKEIYEELLQYKGVGVKTAACVLAFGLGRDVIPVDTHVHRVSNRLGLAHSKTPDKTFVQLNELVPEGRRFLLHTMLIRFGRKICKAKNPLCGECTLYDRCEFKDKGYYSSLSGSRNKFPKENNFIILEHV
jgi:endonuclease-3